MKELIYQLLAEAYKTQVTEWVAAIFGVLSVLFARNNHILLYPFGLISTGVYTYLWSRQEAGLYAESFLNLYYFVMTLYGWWHWKYGNKTKKHITIGYCNCKEWAIAVVLFTTLLLIFVYLLHFTNSTVPYWDATVSASACVGMWLLAQRKIENWLWLNTSNLISIPLFIYKGYYVTVLLTIILFIVAISGYLHWKRLYFVHKKK